MRKGFTLIELLAVIIILAIIALIATPIILNIIEGTKDKSKDLSKELYLRAVNQAIATRNLTEEFNPSECTIQEDGNLLCGEKNLLVEVSGTKPCSGTITFDKKGKITNETVTYCDGSNVPQEDEEEDIDTSVANAPDLMNDALTPVIYNTDHWEIADTTSEWYDYDNQEWANAVILNDEVSTSPGTIIYPDGDNVNIKAMFVWIPRYSYTISSEAKGESATLYGKTYYPNPGAIDIKFVDVNTEEKGSATYTGEVSNYYTHPAFNFGGTQLSGIWVGKFETSAEAGSTCYNTASIANCDNTTQEPYILPNVPSLRYQTVGNQFETAKKFSSYISNSGDSHMMKNSEWGAVAYLSQSKYGKYGNSNYQGANKEVYKNNSSDKYTGRSGGAPGGSITKLNVQYPGQSTSTNEYYNYGYYTYEGYKISYDGTITDEKDISKGTGASTTGNIYGIYDMSGGAYEYVMGYLTTAYGTKPWGSTSSTDYAKFASQPESKYFDAYTDTDKTNDAYKGHALGETSGWYGDYASFVSTSSPWFLRGGYYSNTSSAGVFFFGSHYGDSGSNSSFRVVFAPTT